MPSKNVYHVIYIKGKCLRQKEKNSLIKVFDSTERKERKNGCPLTHKMQGSLSLRLETNSENDFPASSESFLDIVSRNEQKKVQQISKKNPKYLLFG